MKLTPSIQSTDFAFERFLGRTLSDLPVEEYIRLRWENVLRSDQPKRRPRPGEVSQTMSRDVMETIAGRRIRDALHKRRF